MSRKNDGRFLKLKMLIAPIVAFIVITVIAIAATLNIVANFEGTAYYNVNLAMLGLTYILVAAVIVYGTMHRYESKIAGAVNTDRLTSGINYEKFLKDAQSKIDSAPDAKFAVFYGDIQNFKYINDTFGYDVGDNLLMYISERIKNAIGDKGYFARISADNYTAIIPYNDKSEFVEPIYGIIDDVCWYEEIQKAHYKPEIYVGVFCTEDIEGKLTISEMIDRANMAQKSVKGSSEYHIAYYTEEIRERIIAEKDLERRMETALSNGEFKVYYQPKYEVDTGEIVGAEALVRWDSPETGFMSPAKFIPLFEQNGFIINLDQYVFETVCKNMREWLDAEIKVVPVSINVSRLQFYRLDFAKRYTKIKEKYDIPDGLLELEFTESIVFENLEILKKIVLSLKKVGFSCSIDDFGSGYSSLNILKNLPMDTLKLDKLFFKESENIDRDKALISSVITMSRALNMKTVAEGIENWAQVIFLKEIGCDIIQGYVYSEPITCARYTNLLEGNRRKEMPIEFRQGRSILPDEEMELESETSRNRFISLLHLLGGMLIEVDFNKDTYKFVNTEINKSFSERSAPRTGVGYNAILNNIIAKFVHPDDLQTVKNRCSSIAVMSSFYQNETKIITDMRIFSRSTKDYDWAKLTIVRINPDPDANDFRAFVYFEPSASDNAARMENQVLISESVRNALMNICSFIYEFDFESLTFKKLYCNSADVGNQPESGDITWYRECYIPKFVAKSDVDRVSKFLNPNEAKKAFENGKEQLVTRAKATFDGEEKILKITMAKVPSVKEGTTEYKYFVICHAKGADKQIDQAHEALESAVNSTVLNFCDMILTVNISNNTYDLYNTKPPYLNIPNNKSYKEAISKFLSDVVHPDDSEIAEKYFSTDAIKTRMAKDERGAAIVLRCRTKDKKTYVNSTVVSMCYTEGDEPFCAFFLQGIS